MWQHAVATLSSNEKCAICRSFGDGALTTGDASRSSVAGAYVAFGYCETEPAPRRDVIKRRSPATSGAKTRPSSRAGTCLAEGLRPAVGCASRRVYDRRWWQCDIKLHDAHGRSKAREVSQGDCLTPCRGSKHADDALIKIVYSLCSLAGRGRRGRTAEFTWGRAMKGRSFVRRARGASDALENSGRHRTICVIAKKGA